MTSCGKKIYIFTEELKMAVKKATVDSTMAKVEAAKKAETKVTETKTAAKKPAVKKAAPKAEEKKVETKKVETKAAETKATETKTPAKKPAAKKAAPKKATTTTNVVIEYAGGQVSTSDIVERAAIVSGKKSVKTLNVYYQPENGMVYFTADGEEGSFAL